MVPKPEIRALARPLGLLLALALPAAGGLPGCARAPVHEDRAPSSEGRAESAYLPRPQLEGTFTEILSPYGTYRLQQFAAMPSHHPLAHRLVPVRTDMNVGAIAYQIRYKTARQMMENGVFPEEMLNEIVESTTQLERGSLTSLRVFETLPEGERYPPPHHDVEPDQKTTTTVMISAGQLPRRVDSSLNIRGTKPVKLAFMNQEKFKEFSASIDRSQKKHLFEFIACTNVGKNGRFRYLFALAALEAARQVLDQGGRLDEAYVYVHTTREENRQLFTGTPPRGKPEDGYNFETVHAVDAEEAISETRLSDLIDRLRATDYVVRTKEYVDFLEIKPSKALEVLHDTEAAQPLRIDFHLSKAGWESSATRGAADYRAFEYPFLTTPATPHFQLVLHDREVLELATAERISSRYGVDQNKVLTLVSRGREFRPNTRTTGRKVQIEIVGDLTDPNVRIDFHRVMKVYRNELARENLKLGLSKKNAFARARVQLTLARFEILINGRLAPPESPLLKDIEGAGFKANRGPEGLTLYESPGRVLVERFLTLTDRPSPRLKLFDRIDRMVPKRHIGPRPH